MRTFLALLLVLSLGCGRRSPASGGGDQAPLSRGLGLGDVRVLDPDGEERIEPRFGRGEQLQLAMGPHPLAPPLFAVVRVRRADGSLLYRDEPRRVRRGAAVNAAWTVPFALPVAAPSGAYRVEATITDGRGQRAVARVRLHHVSDDAAPGSAPAPAPPATVPAPAGAGQRAAAPPRRRARSRAPAPPTLGALRLRDAAGLPRTRYARSERVTIEVEVGGARPGDALRLRLAGPAGVFEDREGVVPADASGPSAGATTVRQPLRVPPFGAPGRHRLSVILSRGGARVAARDLPLEVVGRRLATPATLEIEASVVAGQGGRRVAVLEGRRARVRVRLAGFTVRPEDAGARVAVSAYAVLRRPDGLPLSPALAVGTLAATLPHRPARIELEGDVELPRSPPGDFILELEARDALGARQVTALRHVSIP